MHREPIYTPRVELVAKYPTLPDAKHFHLPNIGFSVQKAALDKGLLVNPKDQQVAEIIMPPSTTGSAK